jgi:hypothetical protein
VSGFAVPGSATGAIAAPSPSGCRSNLPQPRSRGEKWDVLQLFEQHNEGLEILAESVQAPADDHCNLAALGDAQEFVQRRTSSLAGRYALVAVFDSGRAPVLNVASEFLELSP